MGGKVGVAWGHFVVCRGLEPLSCVTQQVTFARVVFDESRSLCEKPHACIIDEPLCDWGVMGRMVRAYSLASWRQSGGQGQLVRLAGRCSTVNILISTQLSVFPLECSDDAWVKTLKT